MTRLKLFVSKNCPRCPSAKRVMKEIAEELKLRDGVDYSILNIDEDDNFFLALQYQIASTPSFVIDDEPVFVGEVPKKEELIRMIKGKIT
ncbi:MAG: thioredoxin family protein [Candidatus Altiarchaeales archaeon]|nr:MAG: thioredoxin family protein [Candidatus Altiarchaeales archaeon]RLI94579.1 MAG: thioredoxin family protein [Candidatus Altiarchaeales archaeon]